MQFESKEELTKWALEARCLWLFLDYDGTLADFAPTPDHIEPNPAIIAVLNKLSDKPATRVTVLSGRRLGHIRQLLPLHGIFLAGTYGIELVTDTGESVDRVAYDEIRPVLEAIKPRWEELVHGRQGFFVEDKDWALALHARFAEDREADEVIMQARQIIDQSAPTERFRILGGHKFLELAPRLASKRDTVEYLLAQYPFPDSRLLYIGDDDKDEEAFPVIHAHGGVAVKVRQASQESYPTTADFYFSSPGETLDWLQRLA